MYPKLSGWSRKLIVWELYDGTFIEMYINPDNITINSTKKISEQRTKGGYLVQYWGDELDNMTLTGTTGSSGIEGIEILYDLYRSEQTSHDILAAHKAGQLNTLVDPVGLLHANPAGGANIYRSDLVSRATQVVMWYGKKRYHGWFKSFQVTESSSSPGEYTYNIQFTIWKILGRDNNYMPWHRSPSNPMVSKKKGESPVWSIGMHQLSTERINITPSGGTTEDLGFDASEQSSISKSPKPTDLGFGNGGQ